MEFEVIDMILLDGEDLTYMNDLSGKKQPAVQFASVRVLQIKEEVASCDPIDASSRMKRARRRGRKKAS